MPQEMNKAIHTGDDLKPVKPAKKWQPVNIIFGLLTAGCVFYFVWPHSVFLAIVRLVPVVTLVLTRKNNILAAVILSVFGLTLFILPTLDAFLILVSAIYMFFSAVLRMFKVKWHIAIGLTIALILGAWLFKVLAIDRAQSFVPESSLTIMKELNSENGIILVSATGEIVTKFNSGQGIFTRDKGLKSGAEYANRVLNKSGEVVIPLDKWPVFKVAAGNADFVQYGGFNDGDRLPLGIGDYTIQLVKIERPRAVIVAESDFSIVPYDKQTLADLKAYLTVEGDPNRYYDSYTRKGSDSVTAWVQAPKGEVISGTIKFFLANAKGDIDRNSWIGITETAFKTDINGEPVSLRNLSGNPVPGIYHFEIIVDGNVFSDLKYNCEAPSL